MGRVETLGDAAPPNQGWWSTANDEPGRAAAPAIGGRISGARRARHMTQEELAGEIGCDRSSIARWEAGTRLPRLTHLLALSRVLRCAPAALLPDRTSLAEDPTIGESQLPGATAHASAGEAGVAPDADSTHPGSRREEASSWSS